MLYNGLASDVGVFFFVLEEGGEGGGVGGELGKDAVDCSVVFIGFVCVGGGGGEGR